MRITPMKKIREALRLYVVVKLSARKVERATGVPRSTVLDYAKRVEESQNFVIEKLDEIDDKTLHSKLFPERRIVEPLHKKVMPDMEYIHQELKRRKKSKVTLMLLWQEYKADYPNGYEYTQFRVYYRRYKQKLNPSMRQIHLEGDKVFIDYSGLTMPIYNAQTGEITKAQIFVAVLGASGYTFAHATASQKQEDFILSHVLAYEFFGGVPRIVVPDNLKSAIIFNNKDGIVVNESYAALNRHYNIVVEPARPGKPKDKPKAEQGVQGIQRYILARLRHQKFFDIDSLNEAIGNLLDDYNNKIVKHLEQSRSQMFASLDEPHLSPLPANRYVYTEFKIARVNQDYHISLDKCNYSVPFKYLKESVELRYSHSSVKIYYQHKHIATHPRLYRIGATSTLSEHMPKAHEYVHEKMNPQRLQNWAKNIGEYSTLYVENRFVSVEHKPNVYRGIIAVLSFAKLYGKIELELALMYALEKNTPSTKSIKSILDRKLYLSKGANNTNKTAPSLFDIHENIRGADEYK